MDLLGMTAEYGAGNGTVMDKDSKSPKVSERNQENPEIAIRLGLPIPSVMSDNCRAKSTQQPRKLGHLVAF